MRGSAVSMRRSGCTRLLAACLASLLIYAVAFGVILDRPLTLGVLQQQIDAKLARAATIVGSEARDTRRLQWRLFASLRDH